MAEPEALKFERIEVKPPGGMPLSFLVRPGTSDEKAIGETVQRNTYLRRGCEVEPGERWLDLGSNVGGFARLALARGASFVEAYEAAPSNLPVLRANLFGKAAKVVHAAVMPDSYAGDTITLHLGAKPLQQRRHSVMKQRRGGSDVVVPAVRFSSIAQDANVKLNVEGCEIGILSELRAPVFRKLACEWSFDIDPRIATLNAVVEKLRGWYSRVELSRKIPPGVERWEWYPPNLFIYASGRR